MSKARDAFRTISEVAEWMETPAHVLRFWESKFSQVKPVKRAGGRRYYRPADMELLGGIKKLLHDEGMTIKGVQKVLRDQGIAHVSSLSTPVEDAEPIADAPFIDALDVTDTVVPFQSQAPEVSPEAELAEPEITAEDRADLEALGAPQPVEAALDPAEPEVQQDAPVSGPGPDAAEPTVAPVQAQQHELTLEPPGPVAEPEKAPVGGAEAETPAPVTAAKDPKDTAQSFAEDASDSPIPSFLRQPLAPKPQEETPEVAAPNPKAALTIPDDPDLTAIDVSPGTLTALSGISRLSAKDAQALRPVVEQLRAVQDRLLSQRRN